MVERSEEMLWVAVVDNVTLKKGSMDVFISSNLHNTTLHPHSRIINANHRERDSKSKRGFL